MFYCDVCGREISKKIRVHGYTLCSKHMHQLLKHGEFLDNNPRTNNDLNDYRIEGDTVYIDLYNQKNEKVSECMVDLDDIEKVKYHKWRLSHSHVVTGQPAKQQQREMSHIILNIPKEDDSTTVVDHIDCNPANNKKDNLRICTQAENLINRSFMSNNTSGFIGVSYDTNRNRYAPEIRVNSKRCHLGRYMTLEEAVYARLVAENILFKDFANEEGKQKKIDFTVKLEDKTKKDIEKYVTNKINNKHLGD